MFPLDKDLHGRRLMALLGKRTSCSFRIAPMQSEPTTRSKGFLERARLRCSWMRFSKPISLSPLQ